MENFISAEPQLVIIKKHISHYYFHENSHRDHLTDFVYYPHINHAVTAYLDSIVTLDPDFSLASPKAGTFTSLYSRVQSEPQRVVIKGAFKKIGIVFRPYGINHFIRKPLLEVSPETISLFTEWGEDFIEICREVWKLDNISDRVSILDHFLLASLHEGTNSTFQLIIERILKDEFWQNVTVLSKNLHLNRKTIYRLFMREVGCSPSVYFRILKFRSSLNLYLQSRKLSLTQAAIAHHYDQSDFIKNVKAKTQQSPKKLIKSLSSLGNLTYWTFT